MNCAKLEGVILRRYAPNKPREEKRIDVVAFICKNILKVFDNIFIHEYGSYAFKTYLPEGDVDITIVYTDK
jgi:predicted nucleotidyltransferase